MLFKNCSACLDLCTGIILKRKRGKNEKKGRSKILGRGSGSVTLHESNLKIPNSNGFSISLNLFFFFLLICLFVRCKTLPLKALVTWPWRFSKRHFNLF